MKNKKRILITVLTVLYLTLNSSHVFAFSFYQNLQWPFYDPNAESCSVDVDVNLNGNDNIQKAFNFFISQGLSPSQSAGLVGNFLWESSMVPRVNNGGDLSDFPKSSSTAYGIAQWLGGRQDTLVERAKSSNSIAGDLSLQLTYVFYELNNSEKDAGDDLKNQKTARDAALSVFYKYERAGPSDTTGPDRVSRAEQVFKQFGNDTASVSSSAAAGDGCPSSVGPGQNTQFVDGFTVYDQYDPAWANKPYGDKTIGESGCGPSAMAMIITALSGHSITPDVTATYADSQNIYVPRKGSSWSISPVLAQHWNLKSKAIGANAQKIAATLQSGGLVIASGQGPLPFTGGGHFIVIRAVTADGKWKVGDSGHNDTSAKTWEPKQLLASMNDGSVYAISK